METLDYISFAKEPLDQRIDFIDNYLFTRQANGVVSRKFLYQIYEGEKNSYLRKKSLQTICELTFSGIIRPDGTKCFLFEDVNNKEDDFIVLTKSKYLFLLFGDDNEVYSEFQQILNSENPEIKAEAHYRLGLIHLLYRSLNSDNSVSIEEIHQANNHFRTAEALAENRIDARFFQKIADILLHILCEDYENTQSLFKDASQLLWERNIFGTQPIHCLLEWTVHNALKKIIQVGQHLNNAEKWYDLTKELTILLNQLDEFLGREAFDNKFWSQYTSQPNLMTNLIEGSYSRNLSSSLLRIKELESSLGDEEINFKEFLQNLIEKIGTSRSEKKNDELISIFQVQFPEMDSSIIRNDFQFYRNKGRTDEHIALILSELYHKQTNRTISPLITGYQVGDEVFDKIVTQLNRLLPQYSSQKMAVFQAAFADLVRYLVQSLQQKLSFEVLYDPKMQEEKTFQNHLFQKLINGPNAQYYKYESPHAVGGGRVDIVFECENLTYPIEVKKSDTALDWKQILDGYIKQVQTYTGPHNQIGILVNFDQSPKKEAGAINDIRELVEILHLPSIHKLSATHPDYIVAIIIPAGKVSPNTYTKYK